MRSKSLANQTAKWIQSLTSVCEGDINHAKRQLVWLKQKVISDTGRECVLQQDIDLLDQYVDQRVREHKPLQYILGTQPFCDLDIVTRPPTLIPRWETEEWTYKVIDQLRQHHLDKLKSPLRILDICTGSGCIALALAKHLPKGTVHITGLDISNKAIALAKENLQVHQHVLLNPVEFVQQDIFEFNLPQDTFNFIVSNPPYVTLDEYDSLDPDVKSWEDVGALVAEDQGTRVHQRIIQMTTAISPMLSMPYLYMEIGGTHQVGLLNEAMRKHGFKGTKVWKDLADKDRVIVGY